MDEFSSVFVCAAERAGNGAGTGDSGLARASSMSVEAAFGSTDGRAAAGAASAAGFGRTIDAAPVTGVGVWAGDGTLAGAGSPAVFGSESVPAGFACACVAADLGRDSMGASLSRQLFGSAEAGSFCLISFPVDLSGIFSSASMGIPRK